MKTNDVKTAPKIRLIAWSLAVLSAFTFSGCESNGSSSSREMYNTGYSNSQNSMSDHSGHSH